MYVTDTWHGPQQGPYDLEYSSIYTWRTVPSPANANSYNGKPFDLASKEFIFMDFPNPELRFYTKRVRESYQYTYYKRRSRKGKSPVSYKVTETRYRFVDKYVHYVHYPKLKAPLRIWCRKLKDYLLMPHLYTPKEVELAEYIRSKIRLKCIHLQQKELGINPPHQHEVQHTCHHSKHTMSPLSEDYIVKSYGVVDGGPTSSVLSPWAYASNTPFRWNMLRYSGSPESAAISDMQAEVPKGVFWGACQDDIVNEAWPAIKNLDLPTTVTELYKEGLPVRPEKYNPTKPVGTNLRNIASSVWLSTTFGVLPLVSALYDIARAMKRMELAIDYWNENAVASNYIDGLSYTVYSSLKDIDHVYGGPAKDLISASWCPTDVTEKKVCITGFRQYTTFKGHVKTRFIPTYVRPIDKVSILAQMVTVDIKSLVHELVPFSWLGDYFSNAQSFLSSQNNRVLIPITSLTAVTSHKEELISYTEVSASVNTYRKVVYYNDAGLVVAIYYYRDGSPVKATAVCGDDTYSRYHRWVNEYTHIPDHSGNYRLTKDGPLSNNQELNIAAVISTVFFG